MTDELITGATSSTYVLQPEDVGFNVYCRVRGTNSAGFADANSNVIGPITAPPPSGFTFIAGATGGATSNPVTAAMDTTGATLLIAAIGEYWDSGGSSVRSTISDNKGNTWTYIGGANNGSGEQTHLYYSIPISVGAGHTITASHVAGFNYGGLTFAAFSGAPHASPIETFVTAAGVSTTASAAPITPAQPNTLLVSVVGANTGSASVDSGLLTAAALPADTGFTYYGCAMCYLLQTTPALVDPTWTFSVNSQYATIFAAIKPA